MIRSKSLLLACAASFAPFGAALAQAAAPPPAAAGTASVQELVVTARRTAETLQTVPIAISAFTGETLDRLGATDATSLQGLVPNLNLVQGRGSADAANIYIRGLGQPDALQTFDPAVGVYLDDVFLARIRGVLFNLYDLERVEVLRGPQGTLYGKNTIGGALRYITRKPGRDPYVNISLGVGNRGQHEIKATAMGPVSPTLALGASFYMGGHDDYVHDQITGRGYNNQKNMAGRLQAAWTPTESFRMDVSADYIHESPHMTVGQETANVFRTNIAPPLGLGAVTVLYPGAQNGPSNWNYTAPISNGPQLENRSPLNAAGVSAVETWNVSPAITLKSISAFRRMNYDDRIDIDATPFQLGDVVVGVTQRQLSQEFQGNYEAGPIKAVGGLFFMREHVKSTQWAYGNDLFSLFGGPFPAIRFIGDDQVTKSYAAYLNGSYSLTSDLRVTGGLRYTDETKRYKRLTTVNGASPFAFDVKDSWHNLSPTVGVDWEAASNILTYAKYSVGFQSGGFNGRANSPGQQTPYNPEKVYTYELGAKTSWLDRTLVLNVALFYNDYRDFQASVTRSEPDPIPTNPPIFVQTVLNAGKLRTEGVELEAVWNPVRAFHVDAQAGYLDAKYVRFNDAAFITPTNPTGDRTKQDPAFSPKWTARVAPAYTFDLADAGQSEAGSVTVGVGASYRSRMALAVDIARPNGQVYENLYQNGYTLYDARIVWQSADRNYTAGLYAKNLGGKIYKADAQNFQAIAGVQTVYYGDPRTVMFRVTARLR
ncbi:MAG: TonB-dependent receptor [Phenylobacterium sp.]|nr:TonB-dependent receptor [Phenylobacterium sp.]